MLRHHRSARPVLATAICLIFAANPCKSLASSPSAPSAGTIATNAGSSPSYSDLADHVTAATNVIRIQVRHVSAVPINSANMAPQGFVRVKITSRVIALIRGANDTPPEISFLADIPLTAKGKVPKISKQQFLLFVRPANRPDFVQLISRNAMMPWSATLEQRVRAIITETLSPDSPPSVIAVGDAFHVPGTIEGEGETQIFLKTRTGAPVSLSIIRRPGQSPRWGVSLGEVVDETAAQPVRDSLLWYRLACSLPGELPPASVRTLSFLDAQAAQRDYQLVLEGLGTCGRTM